jgi:hypothetical protein
MKQRLKTYPTVGEIRTAQGLFTAIVHRIASRILVFEEICHDELFIKTSTDFVMSIFVTGLIIVKLPLGPLREWLAYPLAAWHRRKIAQCTKMLMPMVNARIHNRKGKSTDWGKLDAIEWSLMFMPEDVTTMTLLSSKLKRVLYPCGLNCRKTHYSALRD